MIFQWRRFFAWYLDLPLAGDGQGVEWGFDFGPSAGAEYARGALIWLAAGAAAATLFIYWREAAAVPWRRRLVLLALRLSIIAILLLLLGRLSLRVDRTELPTVAVLVDASASMGLSDRYQEPRLARAARALVPQSRRGAPTRLQIAQAILTRRDGDWWEALRESHQVRLYSFDEHLRVVELADPDHPGTADYSAAAASLTARGSPTAPARALSELLEEYRGSALSAVVLFTDGIASAGEDERLSRSAALAREKGVPLYPIAIGDRDPVRDLELFDLLADDVVYADEPVTVSFRHRSFGLAGQPTTVELHLADQSTPLAVSTLTAGPDRRTEPLEVTFPAPEPGTYEMTLFAKPLPGEVDTENNLLRFQFEVRSDPLSVLLVEGRPRWSHRSLKPVLERDDTLRLSTFLQSADLEYASEDRTALRAFPATDEELRAYDVVIWGDVDLDLLDGDAARRLRTFVSDGAGGLVLVAGENHNPQSYAGADLQALCPVVLDSIAAVPNAAAFGRFRLQRTAAGKGAAFLRLADDPLADEAAWTSLPAEIDWCVPASQVKPGAEVLATRGGTGPDSATPLIVQQRFGAGQVIYLGTDALWTWRKRMEDRYYGRFWSQAVRAAAAGKRRLNESGRELTSDRRVYGPGDPVRLRFRGQAPEGQPADAGIPVTIESDAGNRREATLEPRSGSPAAWEGVVSDLPPGSYRASLVTSQRDTSAACTFRVELPDLELRSRAIDAQDLEQAARLSHGAFHWFADADKVPGQIPRGRVVRLTQMQAVPLWNRPEFLLLLLGLLSGEWMLRKRARLI